MKTQRKLALVNGKTDQEGGILMYRATNSFEVGCMPGDIAVPPLPFPDDDRDNFDPAE